MAFFFNINQTPTNWTGCMMQLWQVMVSAGWTVLSWSDGATAGGTTHGSPGAGFLGFSTNSLGIPNSAGGLGSANNADAWILMQQPTSSLSLGPPYGGVRQLTFQQSKTNDRTSWRVKYSLSGGYTNPASTGSVTATPSINASINDEVILNGGGTDTNPSFQQLFSNNGSWEGATRCHAIADDGTGPASGSIQPNVPFGFVMWGPVQGGQINGLNFNMAVNFAYMMDPLEVGSAAPQDKDPFIFYNDISGATFLNGALGASSWTTSNFNNQNAPRCWQRYGQSNQTFTNVQACVPFTVDTAGAVHSYGGNATTGADDLPPIIYTRNSGDGGLTGYKGISSFVRWNGTLRQTSDTLSVQIPGFSRDRIIVAHCNLPWDGSSVPII
jgi:hypothetical protein